MVLSANNGQQGDAKASFLHERDHMEETVMNNTGFEAEATATVDAGQEIGVAELLGVEQQQEPAQTDESGVIGQRQERDQKDIGEAFSRERARLEAKYQREYEQRLQSDPMRAVGEQIIQDIMRSKGVPQEVALQMANDNIIRALAAKEGVSPNVARMLFQQNQQRPQERQQEPDMNSRARQIREEVSNMDLPEGFDFEAAIQDEQFVETLLKWPTEAAIQVYHAQQQAKNAPKQVAEQLRARAALPQSMKPQQPVTPKIDYDNMSTEDFFALEARVKEARAKGIKVNV